MASCSVCVVAPPALTSMGNKHIILQRTKILAVTHIWTVNTWSNSEHGLSVNI